MRAVRWIAVGVLALLAVASLAPSLIPMGSYDQQFRAEPDAGPSSAHLLGTDELGRDRLMRLLWGTRISLLLAPAAALLATALAALAGGVAAFAGGWVRAAILAASDLFLSLPWFFLLVSVRALLPLNVSPLLSVSITFALLGCLGWAGAARVVCSGAEGLLGSQAVLLARATGSGGFRLLRRHLLPNLTPILAAQFWLSVPAFILAEANLGMLGLGVAEPLPSWGGLLRELEGLTVFGAQPWLFAPLAVLIVTVNCFSLAWGKKEITL
jgi:ABC-type dipeptide/oligopeptide/nickel transport system permease subunit